MYRGNWLNYIPYTADKRAAFRGKAMKVTKRGGFLKCVPERKSKGRREGAPLRKATGSGEEPEAASPEEPHRVLARDAEHALRLIEVR